MNGKEYNEEKAWNDAAPFLEQGLMTLGNKDRNALILRYYCDKDNEGVGKSLGVKKSTAAKRIERGLKKLRKFFTKKGATLPAAVIGTLIGRNAVQAAPGNLSGLSVKAATAAVSGNAAAYTGIISISQGVMHMMMWAKIKIVLTGVLLVSLLTAGSGVAVWQLSAEESKERISKEQPKKLNTRLVTLKDNTWLYMNPRPLKRKRPTTKDVNSPLKEIISGEPVFREYTSPVYGDGKIYYFGGMHSGYPGNDIEVYDISENIWKQSSYRLQCPPKGDPAYGSGGSENCWVDPKTGAGQPYSIHGYSRTTYHPMLRKYVCTATFPSKVGRNPKSGNWELAEKAYGLISYDYRTDKWELLDKAKPGDLTQWDSALGGVLAVYGKTVWLFKNGQWKRHDTTKVSLAWSGGSASIYLPDRKSHLFALMPHGGANERGMLYIYNSVKKELKEVTSVPAELKKRFVPLGNFVMSYDLANRKVVCMSGDSGKLLIWTYDPAADMWDKLPQASKSPQIESFGPGSGREPLVIDPVHNVFFLVIRTKKGMETWAYRYKRKGSSSRISKPPTSKPNPWITLFAQEKWYKNHKSREEIFVGKLEAIPKARGMMDSTLMRTSLYKLGNRNIYTGTRKVPALDKLVGKQVSIKGKKYDIQLEGQQVREIWPGAVRMK